MKKVEYVVGVFLTETDIVTHNLPEETINKSVNEENATNKVITSKDSVRNRKTEQTTKKKNKPDLS